MRIVHMFYLVVATVLAASGRPAHAVGPAGGDMTFCELYGLYQAGREGDVVGLAVGTTSWNVGTADLMWFGMPNEEHPFIAMNLYRLKDDSFEQIGQSWVKHAFFALGNAQCSTACTFEEGHAAGSWLGMGCTDTYSPQLNAGQNFLGPRYEINPWTGGWTFEGSHFTEPQTSHDEIDHRLQVHDDDLDPAQNPSARYFVEAYYVMSDDVNHMNSAAWKEVFIQGQEDGEWMFGMTGATQSPHIGFAVDAWTGAQQAVIAEQVPPVEFVSPDGRSILASKAVFIGQGRWRYEYAILNVDMDRQVGSFSIPVLPEATITRVDFHAVRNHDDHGAGYSNYDWRALVEDERITWFTEDNPIRWGTMYTLSYVANSAPGQVTAEVGLFKPGTPNVLNGLAVAPVLPPPVCGDGLVELGEDCDPPDGVHCEAYCEWVCGDGVVQTGEVCDPPDGVLCDDDCQVIQICGDGIVVPPEQCDPPDGVDCNSSCLRIIRCGNGILEGGEECDDGNNVSLDGCDKHCRIDLNDDCADAWPIYDGLTPFTNVGATTDGPSQFACNPSVNVFNDVWFDYTATCTGQLQVHSLCAEATFNTHLFVYGNCNCPTANQFVPGCGQDPQGCVLGSIAALSVQYGQCYRIRVGGSSAGGLGLGVLQITCNGPAPVCGNSMVELGESCDDGGTTPGDGCDEKCQLEPPANDACESAMPIGEGSFEFTNAAAVTDGPEEPGQCLASSYAGVDADVWYCYTASNSGPVSIQLCDANYDTKLALYSGCTCPSAESAIACNDDACELGSALTINAVEGESYLLRIGGYLGDTGSGTGLIALVDIPPGDPIRGGLLYDKWWEVNGAAEPSGTHPLYPMAGSQSGPITFRCKECHGWDYKGADGQYGSGPHFTGIGGVAGTRLTPAELFQLISLDTVPNGHWFDGYGLTDEDVFDLIQFISDLAIDTGVYIGPDSQFKGDAVLGQSLYTSGGGVSCVVCHGAEGTQINFGTSEDPEWLGTVAAQNPWEFLHKVRFGQPESPMPSWLAGGGTDQQVADIGRYCQNSFPVECTSSSHCDDGLACTGFETCVAGLCDASPTSFADMDLDSDTDLRDFALFARCYSGPCQSASCEPPLYADPCCVVGDGEGDGDVDLPDFASFSTVITGPQ